MTSRPDCRYSCRSAFGSNATAAVCHCDRLSPKWLQHRVVGFDRTGNPALEAHLRVDGDGLALRINAYAARWTGGGCRPVLELAGLECALALVALDECLAWS